MPFEIKPVLFETSEKRSSRNSNNIFERLFQKEEENEQILTPDMIRLVGTLPDRIFVVGDIHGCRKELETLLDWLKVKENFCSSDLLIFVGDYVDRGNDSAGVIDLLCEFRKTFPNCVLLRGNHDLQFLQFLHGTPNGHGVFLDDGGDMTLASYNLPRNVEPSVAARHIPDHHIEFLNNLKNLIEVGEIAVSHASISNERALQYQRRHDLIAGRCGNESAPHPSGKTSVFGHYSVQAVVARKEAKRMCVDTGCVRGRTLSCVELRNDRIISVSFGNLSVTEELVRWR